ncbi:DUF4403 family protein [Pontibacter qinzhouensis]|uniref:DUF4403 family protein n=1 Tax=Pontibacter qinzhouensis TaxID=2603253 RepID=A0A5C8KB61_9BACT|nr:DUF4403 family protein [Pontibacter qinzhouensis]TXK50258.1 DUF4403 family protein [Pontibacter qinzhouensis]
MENLISIQLPIKIAYAAVEGLLKKQLVGEYIPKPEAGKEESPYAQILDVGVAGSSAGEGTIFLHVKLRILRTLMKRDQVDLYVVASVGYDNEAQYVFVKNFKVESRTRSTFYNKALEVLVNKVAYNQIIQKANVNLQAILSVQLQKLNTQLAEGLQVKGLKLKGAVSEVAVQNILPQPDRITLSVEVKAALEAEVFDLLSLMPPQAPADAAVEQLE